MPQGNDWDAYDSKNTMTLKKATAGNSPAERRMLLGTKYKPVDMKKSMEDAVKGNSPAEQRDLLGR